MTEEHSSPIKTPKQLVIVVLLAFAVPITLVALVSQLVTSGDHADENQAANQVLARIQPVGTVLLGAPAGPKGMLTGEQVFQQVCKTCHETGLAGSPKFGDKGAWAKVIAQGQDTLYQHAINGIRAMPARGGNGDLTDDEVKRAVVYMANAGGANWTAPAVAAAPAAAAAAPANGAAGAPAERTGQQVVEAVCVKCHAPDAKTAAPKIGDRNAWIQRAKRGINGLYQSALKGHAGMPARGGMADLSDNEVKKAIEFMLASGNPPAPAATPAAAAAPAAAAPAAAAADGKKVYDSTCVACHGSGAAGAPKFGDKAAWAPRIKTGMDALYTSAIKGKGVMPPKGGNAALPDADVKAAVDYMVNAAK